MAEKPLKPEDLDKVEELSPEELKQISGGKTAMPSNVLSSYRLLKIKDPTYVTQIQQDILKK